jgi:hypothetical protein
VTKGSTVRARHFSSGVASSVPSVRGGGVASRATIATPVACGVGKVLTLAIDEHRPRLSTTRPSSRSRATTRWR